MKFNRNLINNLAKDKKAGWYSWVSLFALGLFLFFPLNNYNEELFLSIGNGVLDEDLISLLYYFQWGMSVFKMIIFFLTMWLLVPLAISFIYDFLAGGKGEFSIWFLLKKDKSTFILIHIVPILFSLLLILISGLRESLCFYFNILNEKSIFILALVFSVMVGYYFFEVVKTRREK